ncbi:MAG: HD domain-containing protein [Dehalococcoidia bacterium]|nr:HD domain-containing protein [Dehalococcoidia bacterium]
MSSAEPGPLAAALALLRRGRYRVYQFTRGLHPHLAPGEVAEVRGLLRPEEFRLFLHAEPRDRRHSLDLYRLLVAEDASPAMLVAALVHDVGKGRVATWHRVAFVVLNGVSPRLVSAAAAESGAGWRRALWRLQHHAALGAQALEAAGADVRVVELVRAHTGPPPADDAEVARFIVADDQV